MELLYSVPINLSFKHAFTDESDLVGFFLSEFIEAGSIRVSTFTPLTFFIGGCLSFLHHSSTIPPLQYRPQSGLYFDDC
jgi:hypothetical protein